MPGSHPALNLTDGRVDHVSGGKMLLPKPGSDIDDEDLVCRVAQGDVVAFARLYDLHSTLVYSVALKILAQREDAADVLQKVFVILFTKAGKYSPDLGRPAAWLCSITRNQALDMLRAKRTAFIYAERVWTAGPGPASDPYGCASTSIYFDEAATLRAAVLALPQEQREALELVYFGGLSQEEISAKMGRPLGTVKAWIRRGLLKLRESLHETLRPIDC